MNWQPAETAPQDIDVLCWWGAHVPMDVGVFNGDGWQRSNDDMSGYDVDPLYWMPLPPPPSVEDGERE